jgi:hypothetical protein
LDLTAPHRVPLSWLTQHGGDTVRFRALRELAPPGQPGLEALEAALLQSKPIVSLTKRQKDTGAFGTNFLGILPSVRDGIKEPGTVAQFRRLLQLGYPNGGRAFKLSERLLFRVLSRDEDPALLFEHQKLAKEQAPAAEWLRDRFREAATCALAEAGHVEDPRIRGSAHKIASPVSAFLRSHLSEKPFAKAGKTLILHPEAHPPTWYSWAMIAAMPNLQRERAGFTERLGQYLSTPAPKKAYVLQVGKRTLKPTMVLLGDPIATDARGNCQDLPLALLATELLARIGAAHQSTSALRVLNRLYGECDDMGVWRPGRVGTAPKAVHPASYHFYPIADDTKTADGRIVDVTFRLALIARLMGRPLEYV